MPRTTIELPCELGDRVYLIQERKDKKTKKVDRYIIDATVDCVHYGRKLDNKSANPNQYIKLRSVNFYGLLFPALSFEQFEKDCFFTREEADAEIKRRNNDEH